MYIYILLFLFAIGLSVMLNRLFLKKSIKIGVRDLSETDLIRWNTITKPSIGGLTFFMVFLFSAVLVAYLFTDTSLLENYQFLGLLGASTIGFLFGLFDDAFEMKPWFKLLGQFLCANVLFWSGSFIEISSLSLVNYLFTNLWVIGMMNAVNMLDNMDGITGTISSSIIVAIIGVMLFTGGFSGAYLLLMLGVLGGLIGFLFYNWNPAKIYMGDTGSQFLGAFLGGIGILFLWNGNLFTGAEATLFQKMALPLVVFALPIIDASTVTIRRIARGQSPFVGGKDHTTHNLAFWGLKDQQVSLVVLVLSIASILLSGLMIAGLSTFSGLCVGLAFGFFGSLFFGIQYIYYLNNKREKEIERGRIRAISQPPILQSVGKEIKRSASAGKLKKVGGKNLA